MVAIFIEIEKNVYDLALLGKDVVSCGGREGCCLGRELNSNGVKTWRFDPFSQLDTGDGQGLRV